MDIHENRTGPHLSARAAEHYRYAFEAVSTPITRAYHQSMALVLLAEELDGRAWTPDAYAPKVIAFLIEELFENLQELEAYHLEFHNSGCQIEREDAR